MKMQPLTVACPCGTEIEVPVECEMGQIENGRQQLNFHPDYSDLWAHAWTHDEAVEFEFEDVTTDIEPMHEPLPCLICGKPVAYGSFCEEHE